MELRSEEIKKVYKDRMVVKGVNIHVKSGEIVGLLGPNGAGKTTSFYMLVGFIRPTSGKVFIDNDDVTQLPMFKRARHGLGYLAQEPTIFKGLTIEENLLAVLERIESNKTVQKRRVEELLEEFAINRLHFCNRFQFYNHFILYQNIQSQIYRQDMPIIYYRESHLVINLQTIFSELIAKGSFINRL